MNEMKSFEIYRCRRIALGLTKRELANKLDLNVNFIEQYESGEQIPYCVFLRIRQGIDSMYRNCSKEEHYKFRILELALEIQEEESIEQILKKIGHLSTECGKLQMSILDKII